MDFAPSRLIQSTLKMNNSKKNLFKWNNQIFSFEIKIWMSKQNKNLIN